VLVVTHDHRALDVFDRILDMEDGRLSERPAGRSAPVAG
jgi:ABC-type lipoprotein export system ATPase subunit